jgi:hypothetical protein
MAMAHFKACMIAGGAVLPWRSATRASPAPECQLCAALTITPHRGSVGDAPTTSRRAIITRSS